MTSTDQVRMQPVFVIVVDSLDAAAGNFAAEWLGSHEGALFVGSFAHVARSSESKAGDDVLLQIADRAGCQVLIVSHTTTESGERFLRHSDLWVKRIQLVRDARAIHLASLRNGTRTANSIRELSRPGERRLARATARTINAAFEYIDAATNDPLLCRYEDIRDGDQATFKRVSGLVGLDYEAVEAPNTVVPDAARSTCWRDQLTDEAMMSIELACLDYQAAFDYPDMHHDAATIRKFETSLARSRFSSGATLYKKLERRRSGDFHPPGAALHDTAQVKELARHLPPRVKSLLRRCVDSATPVAGRLPEPVRRQLRKVVNV